MSKTARIQTTAPTVGRPRSEATRQRILASTMGLLGNQSVPAITIEAIARDAGVSKATIYRWWNSKALVVIDAFIEHHVVQTPMRRDVAPGEAIAQHMASLIEQFSGPSGRIAAQIVAEGQSDPEVLREFRERFHYGRRAIVREVLVQWCSSGDISRSTDVEMLMDLLYAPIYFRLLIGHAPLDHAFAREHISYAFSLLGAAPPSIAAHSKQAARRPTQSKPPGAKAVAQPR